MTLPLLVLACWAMPGAQAVGVGVHVAFDEHHGWDGGGVHEHGHEGSVPIPAALHELGHRHEVAAPDPGPPGVRPDTVAGAAIAGGVDAETFGSALVPPCPQHSSSESGTNRRRGSPAPLFYAHCSLLR